MRKKNSIMLIDDQIVDKCISRTHKNKSNLSEAYKKALNS